MSTASIAQRQFGGAGTNIIKRGSQRAYRPFAIRPRPVRIMIRLCIGALMLLTSSWGADVDSDAKDDAAQDAADFDEADVVVLNKDNFDNTIQKTEYALVEFMAPWCGFCKELAPEYAAAATALSREQNIVIAKVDATQETELAERFGVDGFPTLKWFVNGSAHEYAGGRDEDSIVRWVTKMTGPIAVTLNTTAELSQVEKDNDILLVGHFAALDTSDAQYAKFQDAAIEIDAPIFATRLADVAKAVDGLKEGKVAMIKKTEDGERVVKVFNKALDGATLRKWYAAESLPLVIPFTTANTERIFQSEIGRHLLLIGNEKDLKADTKIVQEFTDASKQMRDSQEFVFVTVAADTEEGEPVMEYFKLDKTKLPLLFGFQVEPDQRKFKFTDSMTTANIIKFAKGIVSGDVEPDFNSAEIPKNDVEDGVKIVVGKTFEKIVLDKTKDVLLEVYAPWCGHCKALEPIYKQLAERFKDIDSVVIAKMDGTANEHPDMEVEGFPTILFFPAEDPEDSDAIDFEGDRTLAGLTSFIKENAATKFDLKYDESEDAGTESADAAPSGEDRDEL